MKKIHVLSLLSGALLSCVVMLPVIFIADQWGWIWFMMWIVCFLLFSLAVGYALQGYYARKSGNDVKTSENYLWYVYTFVIFSSFLLFDSLFAVLRGFSVDFGVNSRPISCWHREFLPLAHLPLPC